MMYFHLHLQNAFQHRSLLLIFPVYNWNVAGAAGLLHDKRYLSPCLPQSIFKASFKAPVDRKWCDFHCGYLPKPKCYIQAPQVSPLTPRIAKTRTFGPQRCIYSAPLEKHSRGCSYFSDQLCFWISETLRNTDWWSNSRFGPKKIKFNMALFEFGCYLKAISDLPVVSAGQPPALPRSRSEVGGHVYPCDIQRGRWKES